MPARGFVLRFLGDLRANVGIPVKLACIYAEDDSSMSKQNCVFIEVRQYKLPIPRGTGSLSVLLHSDRTICGLPWAL
jgi:hypothetical protein